MGAAWVDEARDMRIREGGGEDGLADEAGGADEEERFHPRCTIHAGLALASRRCGRVGSGPVWGGHGGGGAGESAGGR